jgi:hypothetical protein
MMPNRVKTLTNGSAIVAGAVTILIRFANSNLRQQFIKLALIKVSLLGSPANYALRFRNKLEIFKITRLRVQDKQNHPLKWIITIGKFLLLLLLLLLSL